MLATCARVVIVHARAGPAWDAPAVAASLSPRERDRDLTTPDAARSALARAALRRLLAQELGVAPPDIPLVRREDGSLRCPDGPLVSVSHSGPWAAAAIAGGSVGVDVQVRDPALLDPLLQERSCTPAEWQRVQRHPCAFAALWSRKEAVVKSGVAGQMRDLDVRGDVTAGRWLRDLSVAEGVTGALAVAGPDVVVDLQLAPWR